MAADDLTATRDALGAAVRALVDAVAGSAADVEQLAAATATVSELTDSLSAAGLRRSVIDNPFHPGSLVGGTAHPFGPQVTFHRDGDEVVGEVTLGKSFEGGPGLSHGGVLATIFDHAMGAAMYLAGHAAMTRSLNVHYTAPTRLGVPIRVTTRVDRVEGRRVVVVGELTQDGVVTAKAESVFVQLTDENIAQIFADRPAS